MADRLITGHILAIDRSARAIAHATTAAAEQIAAGHLRFRHVAAEDFILLTEDEPFDVVFAEPGLHSSAIWCRRTCRHCCSRWHGRAPRKSLLPV